MMKVHCSQIARAALLIALLAALALLPFPVSAQSTIATGSIAGTVTDSTTAPVQSAKITITGSTGQTVTVATGEEGAYSAGLLIPGHYTVRVEAKGFKTLRIPVEVHVSTTTDASVKMDVGEESSVVDAPARTIQVNAQDPTVQGLIASVQLENLPLNGRRFIDSAQFEPGVQLQDGQAYGAVKAGYTGVSLGGRFGRTSRVEVDGADISDETVGATTSEIPLSGIQEFALGQAGLDLSTGLTSSGTINVITRSGADAIHGEAFGQFRDNSAASAAQPGGGKLPFQRNQFGGNAGGAIIKDKLFLFLDGERVVQNGSTPVLVAPPLQTYAGSFSDPFRESNLFGRVDYNLNPKARLFYRFSYFENQLHTSADVGYSVISSRNISRDQVLGGNYSSGLYTHSARFSYLNFRNQIADATLSNSSLPFNNLGAQIFMGTTGLVAGPSNLAPQSTAQQNYEFRYDGTRIIGAHVARFGGAYNRIQGGGFSALYKYGPSIRSAVTPADVVLAETGPFPGGSANPLNYPADGGFTLSNGLGYSTRSSALGYPAGGLGPDNRVLLYVGDSWQMKPNFTLTYGLRYERDTNRTDSQYTGIPQLNALIATLGNPVNQPNQNFGPQLGFAWDPARKGKTSIRGGVGLYFENTLWNNLLKDAPLRAQTGSFLQTVSPCAAAATPAPIQTSTGTIVPSSAVCGTAGSYPLIGNVLAPLLALQTQVQAASPLNLNAPNPAYAGKYLTDCAGGTNCFFAPGASMLNPNYRSPRSVAINFGFQREIRPGMVLSADYIRNIQTHYLLGVDQNHAGDTRYFNLNGAQAAIARTLANCGAASISQSWGANCQRDPVTGTTDSGTWVPRPATIADYARNGLGSSADMGGESCVHALGYGCAFGGVDPNAPPLNFLSPVGRSLYQAVQVKVVDSVKNPFQYTRSLNLQISYALSRLNSSGGGVAADAPVTAASSDQDFAAPALDNANVNRYFGPSALDRRQQISLGGYAEMKWGLQLGLVSHLYSPLSTTLTVPNTGLGAGEIFRTDFTGSGVTQDPIPGTRVGKFDRGIDASSINQVISKYNTTVAGQATPAGQLLVGNSLFTATDLANLGAVAPVLSAAPAGQENYAWLKTVDASVSWSRTFFERVTVKPSVSFFNVLNFATFDSPANMMSGLLTGNTGSINGTTYSGHLANRIGTGSGLYGLGAPRQA